MHLIQFFFQPFQALTHGSFDRIKRGDGPVRIHKEQGGLPSFLMQLGGQASFLQPVGFPEQAFEPVPVHGLFEMFFAGRNPDPGTGLLSGRGKDIRHPYRESHQTPAPGKQIFYLFAAFQPFIFPQAKGFCHDCKINSPAGIRSLPNKKLSTQ